MFDKTAVIKKCKEKDREPGKPICLYTKDGKKLLGRHKNRADAEAQERAIQVSKHGRLSFLFREAFELMDRL